MRSAFEAYVEPARHGAPGLWRTLAGLGVLFLALVLGTTIGFAVAASLGGWPLTDSGLLLATLLGLAALIPALWLIVPWLHRRRFAGVLGVGGRLRLRGLLEGAALSLGFNAVATAIAWAFGWIETSQIAPSETRLWLVAALALLIPLQSAAEELVFRGYLIQELAARSRFVLVWLAPPTALFALMHLAPDQSADESLRILAHITLFALFAACLVWITGGLSHAIGAHVANNLLALLVFETELGLKGVGFIAVATRPGAEPALFLLDLATYALALIIAVRLLRPERAAGGGDAA